MYADVLVHSQIALAPMKLPPFRGNPIYGNPMSAHVAAGAA
jgi:hypothetical protein